MLLVGQLLYRGGMSNHSEAVTYRSDSDPPDGRYREKKVVVLKHGPRAYKTATIFGFGPTNQAGISSRSLTLRTYRRQSHGPGWDFDDPTEKWSCEGAQIAALQALLNDEFSQDGRYQLAITESPVAAVIEQIE